MTGLGRVCTLSMAVAALAALPLVAAAQTYPTGSGQSTAGQSSSSQYSSSDQNSPQFHLDEAKRVLDSISTSDLTGNTMTQISQIKTQFNNLYNDYKNKAGSASSGMTGGQVGTSGTGTATDWKSQFNTIENQLDLLNIPKSQYAPSTTGASGTTGTTGGMAGSTSGTTNVTLPSEVRDNLTQFRTHLEQFYSLAQPQR